MMAELTAQFDRLRALYETHEHAALLQLQTQQRYVTDLRAKCMEIQRCVVEVEKRIETLGQARAVSNNITVANLHEEAQLRTVLQRDLKKELFYLDTAQQDVDTADKELSEKRSRWQRYQRRLDALASIEQKKLAQLHTLTQIKDEHALDELIMQHADGLSHG